MSLLGIDVGTTGCKAACFDHDGVLLASAYREYDVRHPQPGWAELDAAAVWSEVKAVIGEVAASVGSRAIEALSVSSLGEAVVPVTESRDILGPSILNFDVRGAAYLPSLRNTIDDGTLYAINGNTLGNHYGLTKLLWIRDEAPARYAQADKFLLWSSFVAYMLGAAPVVDYSLANRTLLFDVERKTWSERLIDLTGLDRCKLPETAPSGKVVGTVAPHVAAELGLSADVKIVTGAHDQCANAVGCGVVREGRAVYGMGTFLCVTPVFAERIEADTMIERGLNTEHHAVPGKYVSFIYNQGGSLVKWYRDTFAAEEHRQAEAAGRDVYAKLFAEAPQEPSGLLVLPHFTTTGPPDFIAASSGVIAGLHLETPRGAILKGIIEGATFYLRDCVETLPATGIHIEDFRAVGGGSKSDLWVQMSADILNRPLTRPVVTEAGALGAAIIAGVGAGVFDSFEEGSEAMVSLERTFEPDPRRHVLYEPWFEQYKRLWPLMQEFLREQAALQAPG
ncbi:MAG: FGGY-family carbohydrate kinase [Anaerolineae bacterium]